MDLLHGRDLLKYQPFFCPTICPSYCRFLFFCWLILYAPRLVLVLRPPPPVTHLLSRGRPSHVPCYRLASLFTTIPRPYRAKITRCTHSICVVSRLGMEHGNGAVLRMGVVVPPVLCSLPHTSSLHCSNCYCCSISCLWLQLLFVS